MQLAVQIYPENFGQYLQSLFEKAIGKKDGNRILYFDVSYLYTFHLSDINTICKYTDSIRTNGRYVREDNRWVWRTPKQIEWQRFLETWCQNEYVTIFDKKIKPIQITRKIDRIVNEGLERNAASMVGQDFAPFKFDAIGDGADAGDDALPSDVSLVNELNRIDVTQDPGGGSLTRDGSTILIVGNHPKTTPTADLTEAGAFDAAEPIGGSVELGDLTSDLDRMLSHVIYDDEITHHNGTDAIGNSIIVYQCSS